MTQSSETIEIEILSEIKESEKKADEILESARKEKGHIVQHSIRNSAKLIEEKDLELRKAQEKKISEFRDKARLIGEEKLSEGKAAVRQLKAKAEKNKGKAAELIIKKFEEAI